MKIKYAIVLEVQPTNGCDPDEVIAALPAFLADAVSAIDYSHKFVVNGVELNGWIKQP